MSESSDTNRTDYQQVLRAIGAYLDQQEKVRFRLIELPDAFTLFVDDIQSGPSGHELTFSLNDLDAQLESLQKSRKFLGSVPSESWELISASHQDFLRALGWELNDSGAHALLIDELEDGLLVSYSFLDPAKGFQWRKRVLVLHPPDMEGIMHAGRHRRVKKRGLRR